MAIALKSIFICNDANYISLIADFYELMNKHPWFVNNTAIEPKASRNFCLQIRISKANIPLYVSNCNPDFSDNLQKFIIATVFNFETRNKRHDSEENKKSSFRFSETSLSLSLERSFST